MMLGSREAQAVGAPVAPAPRSIDGATLGRLALLALAPFVIFVNTTGITAIEQLIGQRLSISSAGLTTVLDITSLTTASLILVTGRLADRLGRKTIYLVGIALFVVGSIGSAAATSDGMLLAFRALQGIGAGPVTALSLGLIAHRLGHERRGLAIGAWGSGVGLGLAAGPLLGAWLAGAGVDGWRWFFVLLAAVAAVILAGTWAVVDEPERTTSDGRSMRLDWPGTVLSVAGVVGVILGVTYGGTWGWGSAPILVNLIGGTAVLVLFVAWQARSRQPLLRLAPFRLPAYDLAAAVTVINLIIVIGVFVYVGLQLQVNLNVGSVAEGVRYLPFSALTLFLSPLFGRVVDRYGQRVLLLPLEIISVGGLLWFALAVPGSSPSYGWLLPGMIALGLATAAGGPSTSTALVATRPRKEAGEASGVNATLVQIGAAIGSGIVVATFASGFGTHLVADVLGLGLPKPAALGALKALGAHQLPSGLSGAQLARVFGATHDAFAQALKPVLFVLAGLAAVAAVLSLGIRFPAKGVVEP